MKKELKTKYDHTEVESGKYENWVKQGYLQLEINRKNPLRL